ncbi:MAG TPA: DNRLRE domain-containing protein [Polyangiaceae bacterium]
MRSASPLLLGILVLAGSCVPPPRMCAQESDCGSQASCVAGRCVAHGATPAIDSARRLLVVPVDVGYASRDGEGHHGAVVTVGRASDPALMFLRFALPLPPELSVLEAYLVLERATSVDADAAPIAIHAAPIASAWDGASLTWAGQPRISEVGSPVTRVLPEGGPLVRVDVRDLVLRWRKRGRDDMGVALVTDSASASGVAFALGPTDVARDRDDPVLGARRQLGGPRLEVYVK